jgi:DNA-binding CsgD family transcriptional regulator
LTKGEISILTAIATGDTSEKAAAARNVAKSTVDRHVEHMLAKSGLRSRTGLILACATHGIIEISGGKAHWTGRTCLPRHVPQIELRAHPAHPACPPRLPALTHGQAALTGRRRWSGGGARPRRRR